jgi:ATP-dependent helicase/nuclease subunit B
VRAELDIPFVAVPYGPAAVDALGDIVRMLQTQDRLAPVDVVVPSAVAGMTVRRRLAEPGLANVRFASLPQLAERLALRHLALTDRRPLTQPAASLAVRAAVAPAHSALATAAAHPQTEALLLQLFVELDESEAASRGALPRLAALGGTPAAVAELYLRYRGEIGQALDTAAMARAAAEAVHADEAPRTSVVLYAARRLSPAEVHLLEALHGRGRLHAVHCEPADPQVRDQLTTLLGEPAVIPSTPLATRRFVVAPDAEEEVRIAVRRVVASLGERPLRPERIAIGYRAAVPYTRLLAEQLSVAGVPHHIPGGRRLTETVAGRVLLGLLDLEQSEYPRTDLMTWLSDGPLRTPDGFPVPVARWDRLSRDAGVSRGVDTWRQRIGAARAALTAQLAASDEDEQRERYQRRLGGLDGLLAFVETLVQLAEPVAGAGTWKDASAALRAALEALLGGVSNVERWGREGGAARDVAVEQAAYQAVLSAVANLSVLDELDRPPSRDLVRSALHQELDRQVGSRTTLGRGVVVAPLRDLAGADLDLLIIVGMTEGVLPARLREHELLRDDDRAVAACGLRTVQDRRAQDRRDFEAALGAARQVALSFPRSDTRAQRRQHPSPWFMEQLQADLPIDPEKRSQVTSRQILERSETLPVHAPASFVAALAVTTSLVSPAENDIKLAMSGAADLITDDRYQRGRQAVQARRDGAFGAWTGHVGPLPEPLASKAEAALSASSLQEWATCPHTFWLKRVLGVRDLQTADDDVIDSTRRGSLVHDVLEQFFGAHLGTLTSPGRRPDAAWGSPDVRRVHELFDGAATALEAQGQTGRPLLWKAERARLHRQLARILAVDSRLRARRRSWPISVELAFGRDGEPSLDLRLPTAGTVSFAGYVDRVDVTDNGELVVLDYKTGKGFGYEAIPLLDKPDEQADLVDRGRKLQLVLYALAAQQRYGPPARAISSYYWFVELGAVQRGATIGSQEEQRLREVLDVAVRGIREGVYPAHPGEWSGWSGWDSCSYCPYDRACASTRGEIWLNIRTADPVEAYAELTAGAKA